MDKLVAIPLDLIKLSNAVKYDVSKKTVFDILVAKVNNIDTSEFVLKTKYDTDKSKLKKKISDASGLVKEQTTMLKLTKQKIKYLVLATISALTAVENKIPSNSSLVKKTDYNSKSSEIKKKLTDRNHDKHITISEFNKFTDEVFEARIARAN